MFTPNGNSIKTTINSVMKVVALPAPPSSGNLAIRIVQIAGGDINIFINIGDSSVSASLTNGMVIHPSGVSEIIVGLPVGATHIAFQPAGGTNVELIITSGSVL